MYYLDDVTFDLMCEADGGYVEYDALGGDSAYRFIVNID